SRYSHSAQGRGNGQRSSRSSTLFRGQAPPPGVSAGFRQRSTKAQAGAAGVGGPPMAHDDTRAPITRAAIIRATDVLTSLSPSRLYPWRFLQPPQVEEP